MAEALSIENSTLDMPEKFCYVAPGPDLEGAMGPWSLPNGSISYSKLFQYKKSHMKKTVKWGHSSSTVQPWIHPCMAPISSTYL